MSPYGLIQETLWPDGWMIIVACSMLNCTSRKQVERVLPTFASRWPTPNSLLLAQTNDIIDVIKSLGFCNRRAKSLVAMSRAYVTNEWKDVRELPGVGEYAARSYEMFVLGNLGHEPPKDHALTKYFVWAKLNASCTQR